MLIKAHKLGSQVVAGLDPSSPSNTNKVLKNADEWLRKRGLIFTMRRNRKAKNV